MHGLGECLPTHEAPRGGAGIEILIRQLDDMCPPKPLVEGLVLKYASSYEELYRKREAPRGGAGIEIRCEFVDVDGEP